MPTTNLSNFLSGLSATITTAKQVRRTYDRDLALEFNPLLQFFHIGENKLSQILAYFLNPNERHGQGDVFLKSFIKDFLPPGFLGDFSKVAIRCEHSTPESRRLDIYLNFDNGKFGVGIENKIWAGDQSLQIHDYNQFLKTLHGDDYCLIYLPPYHKEPAEHSIQKSELQELKANGKYVCRDHSTDLSNLLEIWITQCRAEKVRVFLKDLYQQIQHSINGEKFMGENDLVADYILNSEDNLKTALAVSRAANEIYERMFKRLHEQLKDVAANTGLSLVDYTLEGTGKQYTWFTFRIQEAGKELWIRFQFESKYHNDFYWGVLSDGTLRSELGNIFADYLGSSQKPNQHWLWYNWHENRNWNADDDVHVEVFNGKFAQKIKQTLEEYVPKIKKAIIENAGLIWDTKSQLPASVEAINN